MMRLYNQYLYLLSSIEKYCSFDNFNYETILLKFLLLKTFHLANYIIINNYFSF